MRSNSEIIDIIVLEKDKQDFSLSELARRVGLAKSAMSRYLNKTRQFPLNRLKILLMF
ncbi:Bacteriophage repressor [Streptococcus pneumoniae 801]|nr:Bacteriophage repressor [Streptococcus pneumoniae 801]